MTGYDRLLVLVMCIGDFIAVCSQQVAFQKDSSGLVSMIGYTSVVYGFAADYFLFGIAVSCF
jgi:hypothetical protein